MGSLMGQTQYYWKITEWIAFQQKPYPKTRRSDTFLRQISQTCSNTFKQKQGWALPHKVCDEICADGRVQAYRLEIYSSIHCMI